MVAIASLLVILVLSILITRIATIALTQTGLSRQSARFQARSAFTGVGFTTSESERVVNHPVRRRILMMLMLMGNAGIVAAIGSFAVSYVGADDREIFLRRLLVLALGVGLLWGLVATPWVDRAVNRLVAWGLQRWTDLEIRDYARLLHVGGDYGVAELYVEDDGWLADRTLADLELRDEGITVLGIERAGGSYLGVPEGETTVERGDTLILYGRNEALVELSERRPGMAGAYEHVEAVEGQAEIRRGEQRVDEAQRAHHP